jgi:hypothetical protein
MLCGSPTRGALAGPHRAQRYATRGSHDRESKFDVSGKGGVARASPDTFNVMDLLEVESDQNRVVAFDGRVFEVFGGSVRRFHVTLLAVTISGPDKRGNRDVTLEAAFERFQPLLDALKGAGVNVAV